MREAHIADAVIMRHQRCRRFRTVVDDDQLFLSIGLPEKIANGLP
jgi:hypothetical protein